jgi:hypothetical protein
MQAQAQSKTIAVKPMDLPKFRPTLSLDEDDLPQLKNLITAEVTRLSKGPDYADNDEPKTLNGSFKVIGVEYLPSSENASKSDKLNRVKAKAESY